MQFSIIPTRQEGSYAEAYWSRTRRCCSFASVVCDGAEGRTVILPFCAFIDPIAQHIIETKKHFDAIAEIVRSD
jgi:hypothetical protein